MSDKQTEIADIIARMQVADISITEISNALGEQGNKRSPVKSGKHINVRILALLGAICIFAGIINYIAVSWNDMSSFMRIFITLGIGIGLTALLLIAMKEQKYPVLIAYLMVIAPSVETVGWFVMIHEVFPEGNNVHKAAMAVFLVMTLQQMVISLQYKNLLILFTVFIFFYSFINELLYVIEIKGYIIAILVGFSILYNGFSLLKTPYQELSPLFLLAGLIYFNTGLHGYISEDFDSDIALVITGISIVSSGYAIKKIGYPKLTAGCFLIGSMFFYTGLFEKLTHTPLEIFYPVFSVLFLYLSASLESKTLLLTSAVSIIGFIGYYATEYFLNSLGFPIVLIIIGVALFAVSAMALNIKRKYSK